jgi:hypothetical protein
MIKKTLLRGLLPAVLLTLMTSPVMAAPETILIDDRSRDDVTASSGGSWRLVTDNVMGGISTGQLTIEAVDGRRCLRMTGDVQLDNNGGFVQAALDIRQDELGDMASYRGIMLEVHGNGEQYNVHLRTSNLWLPWQAYRSSFEAGSEWQTLYLPFSEFDGYRTSKALDVGKLKRIGIVAIGREFRADLCIGRLGFYK